MPNSLADCLQGCKSQFRFFRVKPDHQLWNDTFPSTQACQCPRSLCADGNGKILERLVARAGGSVRRPVAVGRRGGSRRRSLREMAEAAPAAASYLKRWKAHVGSLVTSLDGKRQLYLVGRGPSLAAVGTGGLIIKESDHFAAEGMSSAAFRHGPMEMISPQLFVLVFRGIPPTVALNARLVQDIRAAGADAALIDESAAPDVFALPPIPPAVLPLLETDLLDIADACVNGTLKDIEVRWKKEKANAGDISVLRDRAQAAIPARTISARIS